MDHIHTSVQFHIHLCTWIIYTLCTPLYTPLYIYIYIYAFSRRFYPKRLTIAFRLYIFISTCVPWESNPQPFAQLTQCSTTEPHRNTDHIHIILMYMDHIHTSVQFQVSSRSEVGCCIQPHCRCWRPSRRPHGGPVPPCSVAESECTLPCRSDTATPGKTLHTTEGSKWRLTQKPHAVRLFRNKINTNR